VDWLPDHLEHNRAVGFILLKPDAVLRGITGDVIEFLEGVGFRVINFRIGRLPDNIFQRIYGPSFRWDLDYWSLNKEAYEYGPVIGVLLWHASMNLKEGQQAQTFLSEQKGSALPGDQKPGTIRAKFRATSRVFNILHVPDNIETGQYEALAWFGKVLGKSIQAASAQFPVSSGAPLKSHRSIIETEVRLHGYSESHQFDGVLLYFLIKVRLLHAIEKQSNPSADFHNIVNAIRNLYLATVTELGNASGDISLRMQALRVSFEREEQFISSFLTQDVSNVLEPEDSVAFHQVLKLIVAINQRLRIPGPTLDFFWQMMSHWRVYVSKLERYVVTTALIYPYGTTK
jgi:nucleoside diphosphate kinase